MPPLRCHSSTTTDIKIHFRDKAVNSVVIQRAHTNIPRSKYYFARNNECTPTQQKKTTTSAAAAAAATTHTQKNNSR